MTEVIGVRFKKVGKVYYFDPCGMQVSKGQFAIVETARGIEYGEVVMTNRQVEDEKIVKPLKQLQRMANEQDAKIVAENEKLEKEAFSICEQKIRAHGLEMKLVAVEYTFDRGKILFYFTADGRIDFRELVKDLASVFRTRIELRQIGVRDEAKMLGGLGVCGCPLCCATFLDDFAPVSINMAKDQGLSLNPAKISGSCGRLMCCLKYENEAYQDMIRTTPSMDSLVQTPMGKGVVTEVSLVKGQCKVRLENSNEPPHCFCKGECQILKAGKSHGKRSGHPGAEEEAKAQETPAEAVVQEKKEKEPEQTPKENGRERKEQRQQKPQQHSERPRRNDRPRGDNRRGANGGDKGEKTEKRGPGPQRRENPAQAPQKPENK